MMAEQGDDKKWQEIRAIHREYRFFYEMTGGIILVLIGVVIGFMLFPDDPGYRGNLYTTILGVLITIVVLDRRAERREAEREKQRLIREMNNHDSGIVMRAVEELRANGWLENGELFGARMGDANLKGVNLKRANLNGVRFLTDYQLAQSQRLWKAIMPDGRRYNGRFNLPADLARAQEQGIDIHDPVQLAHDYQVSVEDYLAGQIWAKANAGWLQEVQAQLTEDEVST